VKLQITITSMQAAPTPNLPSHLFTGAGSDRATFRVTRGDAPSHDAIAALLYDAIVDACVMEYDQVTGEGYFVVVDGHAPASGTTIELDADADAVPDDIKTDEQIPPTSSATNQAITIEQFYDELDRHDWYHGFSDDGREYRNGSANFKRLSEIAEHFGGDHAALFNAFKKHYFSGQPWSTPQWGKPARPVAGIMILPQPPKPVSVAPELVQDCTQSCKQPEEQPLADLVIEVAEYKKSCISNVVTAAYVWRDACLEYEDATRSLEKAKAGSRFNGFLGGWQRRSASAMQVMAVRSLRSAERDLYSALLKLTNTGYEVDMGRGQS